MFIRFVVTVFMNTKAANVRMAFIWLSI